MQVRSTPSWTGKHIHMVGIKGTGMAALAELLVAQGAIVQGSDGPDKYFTDEILNALQIPYQEQFAAQNLSPATDLVIYSAAYAPESNPELVEAGRRGLPTLVYPQALGLFSQAFAQAAGIAGVHGKTTTTAMAGVVARALGLPTAVLAGSVVPDFGNRATLNLGSDFFIAETCEYKRHFLAFHPAVILVTSVELDHTDYFRDEADIFQAFLEYVLRLTPQGTLIYCADQAGAVRLAQAAAAQRPDLILIPYGHQATGAFQIQEARAGAGVSQFHLAGLAVPLQLRIPGGHNVVNAAGACAVACRLFEIQHQHLPEVAALTAVAQALEGFHGSRRRSQIVGEANGVLVLDDYGHHPTAIETTLKGLREFYPDRRLVVDFMSHTYSRTKSLLADFAASFAAADEVILHKIYASARETETLGIDGRTLFAETARRHPRVRYFEEVLDAVDYYRQTLRPGDLLVTMGAGDNWKAGLAYLEQPC